MDIRQLRYYKEIIEQGSISKAARALNMAQPPLSQLLKKLEQELGTTLIHRYRKKWEVTESGKLLYEYANRILSDTEDVKRQIREIEEGDAGTVRIGVAPACLNILVDYIAIFRKKYPQIKFNIFTDYKNGLITKLKQREIDLALLLNPGQIDSFDVKPLKKEKTILIVPESWTCFLTEKPTIEEIASLPFIMLGDLEDHSLYGKILNFFKKHGVSPDIAFQCKDIQMVVALVNRGLGISIIPRMHYQSASFEQITIYEYEEFDLQIESVLMKRNDASIAKASLKFWEIVN